MACASDKAEFKDIRTDDSVESLKRAVLDNLYYLQARIQADATLEDWYAAVAYCVRDHMLKAWIERVQAVAKGGLPRIVGYLSAEFLIGPQLGDNLLSLGLTKKMEQALKELGQNLKTILKREVEPGLGNGGLGRLAACYMDSLATLGVPAMGYGIRYEFGMFTQTIENGWQVEQADKWLRNGFPWEIVRPELGHEVGFGGHTERYRDEHGLLRVRWIPGRRVRGVPCDVPVIGQGGKVCNILRLWAAQAVESFDFEAFNMGEYFKAVHNKLFSETISKVLYPNDDPAIGKQLRLGQQYFFTSCSLRDMLRLYSYFGEPLERFHEYFAIQLNDTHPAVGVAELMRILVDEHRMAWDDAWDVTRRTFGYTNHTLLPEALEKWAAPLFAEVLPRHYEIIEEINRRFLDEVRRAHPGDEGLVARVSLFDESGPKYVRMAHLAALGSRAVNGVAALHSELLKTDVMSDFARLFPDKFHNVTNGVTPRRWLALCNPRLARIVTARIGTGWLTRFEDEIARIEPLVEDEEFRELWRLAKFLNKNKLAALVRSRAEVDLDPTAMFDVQVKRIHEYKRQHLNILRVIALYNRIKADPGIEIVPRAFLFGGKAAPGYFLAKRIIRLINGVAEVVNADPDVGGRLRVAFFPNFNVKNGQFIYPGADLSEQISLAGKEASGTGNMKFAMNGALTIGTLDGANVEIREKVGPENFFLFGMTTDQVEARWREGYDPRRCIDASPELGLALDQIEAGAYSRGDREVFAPLVRTLRDRDEFMALADFDSYMECQERAAQAYRDKERWTRMSILNVARMGFFSSDRAIAEYCEKIWNVSLG
ncbi:glycogen/starch/alpha-glucan phosphorylase [Fundidesulfovibrio butyratiphilus]